MRQGLTVPEAVFPPRPQVRTAYRHTVSAFQGGGTMYLPEGWARRR